jgi:cobalamin biosynthesis protein CbiG
LHLDRVTVLQPATTATALSSSALWVGIGCKRGTSAELIQDAFETICRDNALDRMMIVGVATLQGKEEEAGLLEFCHAQQWSITFLNAADLKDFPGPNPSMRTEVAVGTPSVAEAAALRLARQEGGVPRLVVPKRSFQWLRDSGAVTLAIAESMTPVFSSSAMI